MQRSTDGQAGRLSIVTLGASSQPVESRVSYSLMGLALRIPTRGRGTSRSILPSSKPYIPRLQHRKSVSGLAWCA